MNRDQIESVATISVMQYLLNAVMDHVDLRRDIADGKDRQETVCFNAIVEAFGEGKPA